VLPYPRLVRLNPNIPFKTRGNAAVCLKLEAKDEDAAFGQVSAKVKELSDIEGGANSGMVLLGDPSKAQSFHQLYLRALAGVVNPHDVRRQLAEAGARWLELGNGMGIVGAAASLGFNERHDHTYELIAYRRPESWGTRRRVEDSSVREIDSRLFPHTFNNYDYQKKKVLIAPHGPDPVFVGIRGDSPPTVLAAFETLRYTEALDGHMVYLSNQHTDAHLQNHLDWKVYSSGWFEGTVEQVRTEVGAHTYVTVRDGMEVHTVAAYEPTGDLRRSVRMLKKGDRVRAFGGVRRATSLHPKVLNLEKLEVVSSGKDGLEEGVYISSPRANRHLTKPLIRYGHEAIEEADPVQGWLGCSAMRQRALA
jgi:tRNA(Ile2)-agmatinylcytidine synthase